MMGISHILACLELYRFMVRTASHFNREAEKPRSPKAIWAMENKNGTGLSRTESEFLPLTGEQKLGSSPHIGPKFVIIVFSEVDIQSGLSRKGMEPLNRFEIRK